MLVGHVREAAVLLVRRGAQVHAVGANCSHYGGPLGDGVVEGDTVRCPWHHACFDLKTGEALSAPALNPIPCWSVEEAGGRVRVTAPKAQPAPAPVAATRGRSIVIVGGGAAGNAAAEMLRRRGFDGTVTVLSADRDAPCDRPNLSKDYLAGNAPEEWIPLRSPEFYRDERIDLVLGARVESIDVAAKRVLVEGGREYPFDSLLLATGAEPNRLKVPGGELPHVHYLRTLADSRAIIAKLPDVTRAVVIGAGFIGLEVAASLRARGVAVDVAARGRFPLEHALGAELGEFVQRLHESHGVTFHMGQSAASITADSVTLTDGAVLPADLVVVGIGVRPRVELAERAGIVVDHGVVVDTQLRTSAPDIFAAGDVAAFPDTRTGRRIRVEHWAVAERHGQAAAENMLGGSVAGNLPPFFWSQHYDTQISYVGHSEHTERVEVVGSPEKGDCAVAFHSDGAIDAVATIGRDQLSLRAEIALERGDMAALAALIQ